MTEKLESFYKGRMVIEVKREGGYATRIEDQYRLGFPDTILVLPSIGTNFVEVKRFTGLQFAPSPRQHIELDRINSGGGQAFLIGVKDGIHHFHVSAKICRVENCTVQKDGEPFCDTLRRFHKEQM